MNYPDSKDNNSLQSGYEFQDFVCLEISKYNIVLQNLQSKKYQFAMGENLQGFEIKLDRLCTRTGRLSIEIAEKTSIDQLQWIPSGIYRPDNSWLYIHGNYDIIFIFQKNILKLLHASKRYNEHEEPTVKAFYLPLEDANKYAGKVIKPCSN